MKQTYRKEIIGPESSDVVRFDLGPLLQSRVAKLKSAYILLISGSRVLGCENDL